MLKKIAYWSKVVSKYSYYPIFLGIIAILAAIVNDGKPLAGLSWFLFAVCAVLSVFSFLSGWLCKKAGIDPTIR